jgi:hypothetical protein
MTIATNDRDQALLAFADFVLDRFEQERFWDTIEFAGEIANKAVALGLAKEEAASRGHFTRDTTDFNPADTGTDVTFQGVLRRFADGEFGDKELPDVLAEIYGEKSTEYPDVVVH